MAEVKQQTNEKISFWSMITFQIQGNIKVLTNERDSLGILYEQVSGKTSFSSTRSNFSCFFVRQKTNYNELVTTFYKILKHQKFLLQLNRFFVKSKKNETMVRFVNWSFSFVIFFVSAIINARAVTNERDSLVERLRVKRTIKTKVFRFVFLCFHSDRDEHWIERSRTLRTTNRRFRNRIEKSKTRLKREHWTFQRKKMWIFSSPDRLWQRSCVDFTDNWRQIVAERREISDAVKNIRKRNIRRKFPFSFHLKNGFIVFPDHICLFCV